MSNALLKSVYTQSTCVFDSNEPRQKLENSNRLVVVDLPLVKPCWWLEISFSKTLGMHESLAIGLQLQIFFLQRYMKYVFHNCGKSPSDNDLENIIEGGLQIVEPHNFKNFT